MALCESTPGGAYLLSPTQPSSRHPVAQVRQEPLHSSSDCTHRACTARPSFANCWCCLCWSAGILSSRIVWQARLLSGRTLPSARPKTTSLERSFGHTRQVTAADCWNLLQMDFLSVQLSPSLRDTPVSRAQQAALGHGTPHNLGERACQG